MTFVRRVGATAAVMLCALVASAGASAQPEDTIPWLTDPAFSVTPNRLVPGQTAVIRMSAGWPAVKAPCTAAGAGRIAVVLSQRDHVFVWPLQPLADRTFRIAVPSVEQLRVAGIRRSGAATLTAIVHGCAKRNTFFGRDDVVLVLPHGS